MTPPSLCNAADLVFELRPEEPPREAPPAKKRTPRKRKIETRICEAQFCQIEYIPRRAKQKYCSRRCAFKRLKYSKHRNMWRGISEERDYSNNWDRDDE